MRTIVHSSTPELLKLSIRSNNLVYFCGGMLFVALGGLSLWALGYQAKIEFRDNQLSYSRDYLGIWRTHEQVWSLAEVESVSVETVRFGIYTSMEVMVTARGVKQTLSLPADDGDKKTTVAEKLKRGMAGEHGPFVHSSGVIFPSLILAITCVGVGVSCWSVMQRIVLEADRIVGEVRLSRRTLFSPRPLIKVLPFESLGQIHREEFVLRLRQTTSSFQVYIADQDGSRLPLAFMPMFTDKSSATLLSIVKMWCKPQGRNRRR